MGFGSNVQQTGRTQELIFITKTIIPSSIMQAMATARRAMGHSGKRGPRLSIHICRLAATCGGAM